jgi:hypothetical protein
MTIIVACVLAVACGPAALTAFVPATIHSPVFCFIAGGLQIAVSVMLYLMVYAASGADWPWILSIAFFGVCYVSRGLQLRQRSTGDTGRRRVDRGH